MPFSKVVAQFYTSISSAQVIQISLRPGGYLLLSVGLFVFVCNRHTDEGEVRQCSFFILFLFTDVAKP